MQEAHQRASSFLDIAVNKQKENLMPFLMWAALAVAVLMIAANSSKVVIEIPQIVSSAMQPASRGFGAMAVVIAAIIVIVAVVIAVKYRKGSDK